VLLGFILRDVQIESVRVHVVGLLIGVISMSGSSWEQSRLFDIPESGETGEERKVGRRRKGWLNPTVADDVAVSKVWDHYVATFWSGRGVSPKLSEQRRKLIAAVVAEYDVDVVLKAIEGCSLSEWHMGGNPSGKRYVSIELILRDPEHVERFSDLADSISSKGGFLDEN